MQKLREIDNELFKFYKQIIKEECYKKANKLRDDLIHNYSPNRVSSGMECKKENGNIEISMTPGDYIPTNVFVENMEGCIDLLARVVEKTQSRL